MVKLDKLEDRIRYIIAMVGLTKTAFAQKINVTPAFISLVCKGGSALSDRTIADICREYSVNEIWLRTGEGEPFRKRTRQEEIAEYMSSLIAGERTETEEAFIAAVSRMRPEDWHIVEKIIRMLHDELNK